jgi:hypothetical protein
METDEHIEIKQVQSTSNGNMLSVLETRRGMYAKAVEAAKASEDNAKVRRLDRQLKVSFFVYGKKGLNISFDDDIRLCLAYSRITSISACWSTN